MTDNIQKIQYTIAQEFASLGKDPALVLDYLIDLGANMEPLPEKEKIPQNLVSGCLAQVWLVKKHKQGRLWLNADSNATITKGLVSLLVRTFSGQPLKDVIKSRSFLLASTGLDELIGPQRRSGFDYMLQAIVHYAWTHKGDA